MTQPAADESGLMIVVKEIRPPAADCATIILPVGKQLPGDRPRPLRVGTVARILGSAPVIIAYGLVRD